MLDDPEVQDKVSRILGSVDRSAGSSGFLKDYFVDPAHPENYDQIDGMFNYESLIIEANQTLTAQNQRPGAPQRNCSTPLRRSGTRLRRLTPGLHRSRRRHEASGLSDPVGLFPEPGTQEYLRQHGRRIGFLSDTKSVDTAVFNPELGDRYLPTGEDLRYPDASVINQALNLYTLQLRRPTLTVLVADISGSMGDAGGLDN